MPELPLITVVTPSFNQADFLERTIQSVLNQQYPALEYIVADGGSTDTSASIIQRYAEKLSWWCSERDHGQADALAKGFARATGEVLCWLNSDDILLPGALQAVGEYFRDHPEVSAVNGRAYSIDAHDQPIRRFAQSDYTHGVRATARRFRFYGQDGVYQPASFWRRAAYEGAGGIRKEFSFAMDLDLFTRMAAQHRFEVIPRYLACFRVHGDSKTGTMQHVRSAEVLALQREHGVLDVHPVIRSVLYSWYRTGSLFRKSLLQFRSVTGIERFPAIPRYSEGGRMASHAQN